MVPKFSEIIQPLIDLTKSKAKFVWSDKHDRLFKKIQDIFFRSPMVRLPDWDKTFFLNTDASNIAIGAAILQEHEGKLLPIAYFSKSLKSSEK